VQYSILKKLAFFALSLFFIIDARAATHPLGSLSYEYSGHIETLSIGGSLRASKDLIPRGLYPYSDAACKVNLSSSANLTTAVRNPAVVGVTGIPAGSTILAAHLYWVGSYSTDLVPPTYFVAPASNFTLQYLLTPANTVAFMPASNATAADYAVTLNGTPFSSDKLMTDTYLSNQTGLVNPTLYPTGIYPYDYFSGHANVTSLVAVTGNGLYTFSGLTVNTGGYQCFSNAVVAGWALHVIYSNPAEPFRVVKLYDGLQIYHDAFIDITPSGFTVPVVPKGKVVITTWEGDEANSAIGGVNLINEDLLVNVFPSTIPTFKLGDTLNPLLDAYTGLPNQFNGTVNTMNPTTPLLVPNSTTSVGAAPAPWGVDVDHYDISAELSTGQTSLTTRYSSGADLVILSSEMIVVDNNLFADLAITKSHVGNFTAGLAGSYNIAVTNNGPNVEAGPINVVDTLPVGMNFVSAVGTGWTCSVAGSIISCSIPGPLAIAASVAPLTVTVNATAAIAGTTVTNTATVSGALTDNITLNNTSIDPTIIVAGPIMSVTKTSDVTTASPGSPINYTVVVTNVGSGAATTVSQDDALSAQTAFGIECMPGGLSIVYTDGVPASTLLAGTLAYSNDNGVTFTYVPPAVGGAVACTYDPNITNIRLPMTGSMPSNGTYSLQYQVQVK